MKVRNNLAFYSLGSPDQGRTGQATDYFGIRVVLNPMGERRSGVFRAVFPAIAGFDHEEPLRPAQVTDGLSSTILLVESAGRPQRYARGRPLGVQEYYAGTWAGVNGEMFYAIDPAVTIAPAPGNCFVNCNNFYTPYSFHPGVAIIALCDGSARGLSETVDFRVWWGLAQPDDGQVLGNF